LHSSPRNQICMMNFHVTLQETLMETYVTWCVPPLWMCFETIRFCLCLHLWVLCFMVLNLKWNLTVMWLVTGNMFAVFNLQLLCKRHSFVVWMDPSLNLLNCIVVVDIYIYIFCHVSMKRINCVSLCCMPPCKNLRW